MRNIAVFIILIFISCRLTGQEITAGKQKMKGAWLTTVDNIDWPSRKGLNESQQKNELLEILDFLQKKGFTDVFFQVRPSADAFYNSTFEPWSVYLTGEQGRDPGYDPLTFIIEECHNRKLKLHAWLNPYRAIQNIHTAKLSPGHITRTHPEWFVTYGKQKLFNPGNPAVWKYICTVVADLITKYPIDGIHMDDYFYPYRQPGKPFPDQTEYSLYNSGLSLDDWRRKNVDNVIQMLHDTIKSIRPSLIFGISPFGVWRNEVKDPRGSETRAGQTNYDDLYADIIKWLKNDWIDYVAPQLYWECGHRVCNYNILLKWWKENSYGKPVFAGLAAYRVGEKTASWNSPIGINRQAKMAFTELDGVIYYNTNSVMKNKFGWIDYTD